MAESERTLRERIAELIAGHPVRDVEAELKALAAETAVDALIAAGHLNAAPETRAAALTLHRADPDALRHIATAPRPTPAAAYVVAATPPATDPTEEAIQASMRQLDLPYHLAAAQVGTEVDHQ